MLYSSQFFQLFGDMNYSDTLQPPSRLIDLLHDRYAFLSVLGRGGSGMVYEVRNQQLGRIEALKVLTNTLSTEMTRRFTQEARISASLDHPGIVKVYDFGQLEGVNWYSMEFIEGPSLSTIIDEGIRLDAAHMSRLGIPLLNALAYSHGHGVIHRDIKPANIMLHMSGDPCLTDFGIAKSMDSVDNTQTGSMMGTPAYMSPEQAEGKHVDGRADQYSLALTLYRAVTGRLPFSSAGPVETLLQRLKEDPEPIDWHCPDFPAPLRDVLMKALSRDRNARFLKIEDMRNAMQSACEACRIQWNRHFEGFEHIPIVRRPINLKDTESFYETGMTTATRKNKRSEKKSINSYMIIGSVAVAALAGVLYSRKPAVENQSQATDETPLSQVPNTELAISSISHEVEAPTAPVSNTKTVEVSPTPVAPAPIFVRRAVSPPLLQESNTPSSIVIPPDLAGKQVRAIVKVGEDGKVIEFRVLDKNLTPVEIRIATAIAMNMVFSPALAEDGKPVVSEISVAIAF